VRGEDCGDGKKTRIGKEKNGGIFQRKEKDEWMNE
jgi:hypothetical protein